MLSQSVVEGAIFCLSTPQQIKDANRLKKLIRKAGSVVGTNTGGGGSSVCGGLG